MAHSGRPRDSADLGRPKQLSLELNRFRRTAPIDTQNRVNGRLRGRPDPGTKAPDVEEIPVCVDRRAHELDTIAAVLPMERRDELAELLTDQDIETLKHLVERGMGDNTLRALTSDLAYIEAWGLAATGSALPWPVPEALLLKFVAQHLWDPEKRATDASHGMPADIDEILRRQGFLKSAGPHAPATVRRRLGELVDADPMARPRWCLRVSCAQVSYPLGYSGVAEAASS